MNKMALHQKDKTSILASNILNVPILISMRTLPDENENTSLEHCSEDVTILLILEGSMTLQINGKTILLQEGDAILINAERALQLTTSEKSSCRFYSILFNPILFLHSVSLPGYINDMVGPDASSFCLLKSGSEDNLYVAQLIHKTADLPVAGLVTYRLHIMGYLHLILARFLSYFYNEQDASRTPSSTESRNLDKMLNYIHNHYQLKIQLSEIASAGNVSRSRCSPLFRKYLHVTPIEYVNDYRLEISRSYLLNRKFSIADVATACGFSGQSYYTKLFVRKYGYTPTEYRNRNL